MYYPKSQIISNLYTNGNEFITFLYKENYIGFYFKTSNGKFFSGKTPDDKPNVELIPTNLAFSSEKISPTTNNAPEVALIISSDNPNAFEFITNSSINTTIEYLNIKNIPFNNPPIKFLPYYSPTLPTQQDYQIGEFQRYFCKKTNEILYIEINQEQFNKLVGKDPQIEFSLYQPFTITWILTGDKQQVAKTNKNIVELASVRQKLPKFDQYLKFDYTKYFQ